MYQLTCKAEDELEKIYEYSILNFGITVARDYLSGFHNCFILLSDNQSWGSDYGFIKPQLCRYEYRSHSIYYEPSRQGVLIVRVLGNRQDPARQMVDE